MKKMFLAAAAMAMSLPGVAQAAATVTINFSGTTAVPSNNDFQSQLSGLGLNAYTALGASLIANGPVSLTFEFLGSESGYSDTFSTGSGVTYTESSWLENHFAAPILIGTTYFAGGDLKNFLNFTTSGVGIGGANATVGDEGFGIFLSRGMTSGSSTNVFYLGFDDQISKTDDNHDDFIVRVTVNSPVPEPSTWAMLLFGFGVVGFALRRRVSRTASFA
ncbi:MAG: PEP-CTERM sorting domain-containing protein [Sphingomonadales bacterium]|mgnify:FL=1|jgi:hypothetical protein|nr:PEP-CTERM sorting domain-containing protein [Sphingomonadales bacterium]MBP7136255.1 PEP-CTERM sorting domain-containing protein [Sphingomonadaceae bacterium]